MDPVKVAVLKFSSIEKFVSVYGCLSGVDGPDVHRLCLDSSKVVPLADLVFLDGENEKEVFNLWKVVKDGLCLPLLIDICKKNRLPFPPCFVRPPTDLKFMILELLSGVDVARFGCASSELRYLSGNDELWKQKFVKEFGVAKERKAAGGTSWKEKFKKYWVKKRNAEMMRDVRKNMYRVPQGIGMPRYPPFAPRRFPMWGGDYDAVPFIGGSVPIGGLGFPNLPRWWNCIPHCNFDGCNHDFSG
ncbi:F-box protein SKIP22-like [Iris pallida]|uniref:F-box protein SKIP22-like n=1 Tax=Iris pallida TaxID=29817 RepID=A0AAX6F3X2_IRIPA|nr:F-box protein SKIP22-like [Iris pallida]